MVQSTGHGPSLQERDSEVAPHAKPPSALYVCTVRARVCVPAPQLALPAWLHEPQPAHAFITQSTGQFTAPQAASCVVALHAAPPCFGDCTIWRVRVFVPPPHETEHAP